MSLTQRAGLRSPERKLSLLQRLERSPETGKVVDRLGPQYHERPDNHHRRAGFVQILRGSSYRRAGADNVIDQRHTFAFQRCPQNLRDPILGAKDSPRPCSTLWFAEIQVDIESCCKGLRKECTALERAANGRRFVRPKLVGQRVNQAPDSPGRDEEGVESEPEIGVESGFQEEMAAAGREVSQDAPLTLCASEVGGRSWEATSAAPAE